MKVIHELDPWFDKQSKILILGTMPSVKSREEGYYYAHPQNRFWPVMEHLFHEKITDRKAFCISHHIALWDTLASCEIASSKDASIKQIVPNDLQIILKEANINQIFTTGKKAHEIYQKYMYPIYQKEDICLPSTSPANATYSKENLVTEYQIILKYLKES